jgi:hypothetical protein
MQRPQGGRRTLHCPKKLNLMMAYRIGHCSNRRVTRQSDDARATMPVAARALHVTKRNSHRGFGIAWFDPQIQIDHGPATITRDD